ncbi:MAG: branched-chain amino acid ABC transporter permease [Burkholderiales bacterium]|nr:branched-chain amino acid ABC transporter permease [Burkholderiales bacterium]
MADLVQLLVSGCATGAVYALAAMGFVLLWQTSGTINFAQGEFVMLPAFAMLAGLALGLPLPLAFLASLVVAALVLGAAFKRVVVDPLVRAGVLPLVVATLGLSLAAKHAVRVGFSAEAQPFPQIFPEGVWNVLGVRVSAADVGTLLVAGALLAALHLFITRTLFGRSMQACAQNPDAARVLGIDVAGMILATFVINALLAACAALLVTPVWFARFDMGEAIGLKAFFAAIIGGFNQMRGALLGGILLGVLENLAAAYLSAQYKDGVALALFVLVILFRPEGLLGRAEERKV